MHACVMMHHLVNMQTNTLYYYALLDSARATFFTSIQLRLRSAAQDGFSSLMAECMTTKATIDNNYSFVPCASNNVALEVYQLMPIP